MNRLRASLGRRGFWYTTTDTQKQDTHSDLESLRAAVKGIDFGK